MTNTKHNQVMLSQPRRAGFTLVEMLVVMLILSVCVALIVGVTNNALRNSKDNETHYIQDTVLAAIKVYHDETGNWPPADPADPHNTTAMLKAMRNNKPALAKLKMLPKMALQRNDAGLLILMDGYGYPMEYFRTGGLGGKSPQLVSQGAALDDMADNINAGLH
ncbi:MAG: prepilin-type N-terminal cleavage/methylation domain-containing protein [Phycisphaerae bacterium]|nr:prepilin-type N-terminal cleavage/methylation domain-containing protein [Phycisphaerae bacterium]